MIERLRKAHEQLIEANKISGEIERQNLIDNGRGQKIPDGNTQTHTIFCRIAHESGGVWKNGIWDGGLATNKTNFLIVDYKTDIKENDILTIEYGIKFRLGLVSYLWAKGEVYGKMAELFKAD